MNVVWFRHNVKLTAWHLALVADVVSLRFTPQQELDVSVHVCVSLYPAVIQKCGVLDRQDTVTSGLPHGSHIACSQTHPSRVQSFIPLFLTLISLHLILLLDASNSLHRKIERAKEKEQEMDTEIGRQSGEDIGEKKQERREREMVRGNKDVEKTDRGRMGGRDRDRLKQS